MPKSTRILIVEDSPADAELAEREILKTVKPCRFKRVETRDDYLNALRDFAPDVIISDYNLPHFDGLAALKIALERAPFTPLIIFTGSLNEDTAVECMKSGASNYVIKEHIKRLGQSVHRALQERQLRTERHQVEEALRASEERYRGLYENATVGIYRTTPDGRILMANEAAVQMLGFDSFEDLAHRNLESDGFAPSYSRDEFRRRLENEGVIKGLESAWARKDSSLIFVRESARVVRDEEGNVLHYDGTFEDISERVRAEGALRESEARYRLLFESNPHSMWVYEIDTLRFLTVNDAATRNYGFSREEFLSMTLKDIRPPEDIPELMTVVAASATAPGTSGIWRHRRKDGAIRRVEIISSPIEFDGKRAKLVLAHDVTEREQATESLRKLSRENEEALQAARMGHWQFHVPSGLFEFNDQYYRLHGTTSAAMGGHRMTSEDFARRLVYPDDVHKVGDEIRLAIEARDPNFEHETECRILRANGEVRWVNVWFRIEKDARGNTVSLHGVNQDITERKRSEQALQESEERFRTLYETMIQGVVYQDADGHVIGANPAAERILGLSLDRMRGRTSSDPRWKTIREDGSLLPGEDHPSMIALRSGKEVRDIVLGVFNPQSGQYAWLNVCAVPLFKPGESEPHQVYTTFEDITERRAAELAFRETSEKLQLLVNASPIAIIALDTKGIVTLWNPAAERMFGWSAREAIGQALPYIPENRREEHREMRDRVLRGVLSEFEVTRQKKDGTPIELRISTAPMHDAKGNTIGIMSINVDITERKRAEMRLQERNKFIDIIMENAPIGFAVNTIHDGKGVFVSGKFEDIYGVPRGRITTVDEYFENVYLDPAFREQIRGRIMADMATGDASRMRWEDIPITTLTGEQKVITAINIPLLDQNLMVSTVQDVTERSRAQTALRDSEERYHSLFISAPDAILLISRDGRILDLNPIGEKILEVTREQILDKSFRQLRYLYQSSSYDVEQAYQRILNTGHLDPFELDIRLPNGTPRWLQISATPLEKEGQLYAIQVIINDITERRRSENELRDSEARFRLISENVADLIAVYSLDGKRLYASPSFQSVFGDPLEQSGSDPLKEIYPEDREKVESAMLEILKTGMSRRIDHRLIARNGSIHDVESQGSAIRNEKGEVASVVVVSRDVTEKKLLERQFLRSQRLESLGTLAGGIAHDLNNVLNPILLSIEALRKHVTHERGLRILQLLETSVNRGSGIIRQVLGFARGLKGDQASLQISALVREISSIMRETFPRNISIFTSVSEEVWNVKGDSTLLHQLLMNLCVNARDAMPSGGTLTVAAENKVVDEQYAHMHMDAHPGHFVVISVEDTGTGMTPEVLDRVFEPFFTTKEFGKGTGLGLSTVHTIVKSHSGFVTVYSEVGKGTTFKVHLPASEADTAHPSVPPSRGLLVGKGELILVVDDEASICQITQETLETFGYRAITATDGAEALTAYASRQNEIACVITDMMMPVMDGASTIRGLHELNPNVKIIATSGLIGNGPENLEGEFAVDAFVPKPFTAEKLLRTLHDVLGHKERPQNA